MPFAPDIYGLFDGITGLVDLSVSASEQITLGVTGINHDLSAPIVEQLNLGQQADLSNPLMNYAGSPVLLLGVDPTTGVLRPLTSSDPLVRTNGSPAFATGIHGLTGIRGITGIAAQGATGLLGATGIAGTTGVAGLLGYTGVLGTRGATGLTGNAGIQGGTGLQGFQGISPNSGYMIFGGTGLQGATGFDGATGISLQGFTGLGGLVFDQGTTGLSGITGVVSSSLGLTGLQGVEGSTGLRGITGASSRGASQPLNTLNVQSTPASNLQYTISGNTLAVNGNSLDIISFGSLTANTSNSLLITFGGSTIFSDTNIFAEITPSFYVKCHIFRNSATEQLCVVEIISSNAYKRVVRTITTHTLSSNLIFSITTSGTVDSLLVRLVS